MNFTTIVPIESQQSKINYQTQLLFMGSCFAENIAKKMQLFRFQSVSNPFGILFNPLAIEKIIEKSLKNDFFSVDDFFENNELWHCFDFHSSLSQDSAEKLQLIANQQLMFLKEKISKADYFFITLGSAWVYERNGTAVANCHKMPSTDFQKKILLPIQIQRSLQHLFSLLMEANPALKIVFSVSPVRHLKDGFVENQRSKAHLITALHSFLAENQSVSYFPAYEIMMDELRDYRFYADDLLHPSELAISYIWERFSQNYIDSECFSDMKIIESIQKGLQHRPFNPESQQFLNFKSKLNQKIKQITQKYPFMSFDFS